MTESTSLPKIAPGRLRLVEVEHVRVGCQLPDAVAELTPTQMAERPPEEIRPRFEAALPRHADHFYRDAQRRRSIWCPRESGCDG